MKIQYTLLPSTYKLNSGAKFFSFDAYESAACAKNSSTAFQIALNLPVNYAVNSGKYAWFSQRGQIPVIRIETECDYPTTVNIIDMHLDENGIARADALLTSPVVEYSANDVCSIYFEISVPADAKSGEHHCKVKLYDTVMFNNEQLKAEIDVPYTVYDYVMPDVSKNKFHLDLWQHISNIARKHEVALFSDEHFAILESYVKSLGELGQKAVTLIVSEVPWSGQSCFNFYNSSKANLFEYSIVSTVREIDGSYTYDYSAMQRYIDLCAKYSIDREISLYGLANIWRNDNAGFGALAPDYPDAIRIRYLDKADGCYKYMRTAAEIDDYITSLEQYFIKTGQINRVRLAADEPGDIEAYRSTLAHIISIAPAFKFKAAINHAEFVAEFGNEVYDFVPFIGALSSEYDKLCEYKATMSGKRFLYYVCCGPDFPNTFLRSNLCETLFIGVLASYANLDGFLRWNYTVWNDEPRNDIRYNAFSAGDINFVYPSTEGKVMLTLRYKALKAAIELYELLEAVKGRGLNDEAEKAYSFVVREKDIRNYYKGNFTLDKLCSTEYKDYNNMKKYLLEILSK